MGRVVTSREEIEISQKLVNTSLRAILRPAPSLRCRAKVVKVLDMIPREAFVASGLGSWRQAVLALAKEPGAPACRAYIQVAGRVVSAGESVRQEQTRVAGDTPASCHT